MKNGLSSLYLPITAMINQQETSAPGMKIENMLTLYEGNCDG